MAFIIYYGHTFLRIGSLQHCRILERCQSGFAKGTPWEKEHACPKDSFGGTRVCGKLYREFSRRDAFGGISLSILMLNIWFMLMFYGV